MCLTKGDQNKIELFKNKWQGNEWYVHIMTFNYSRILDNILELSTLEKVIGSHNNDSKIKFMGLHHIHGYTNESMVFGVNDLSQITNSAFHSDQDILESLIKPECNKANDHTVDDICVEHINSADLICIFGSSIGETDNFWWNLIVERFKKSGRLIIFSKGEEIENRFAQKKKRIARDIKNLFLKRTQLTEEEKRQIENQIFVSVNSKLFADLIMNKS